MSETRIQFCRTEAGITEEADLSLAQILNHLMEAAQALKTYQRNSKQLRETYLETLAENIVLHRAPHLYSDNLSSVRKERTAATIKQLIAREQKRRTYWKLRKLLNPTESLGLHKIDIPDARASDPSFGNPNHPKTWTGPWLTVTEPTKIATIIKDINRQQYHQAHSTPFGSGPLADLVSRARDTPVANKLIQDDIPKEIPLDTPSEVQRIVQILAREYPTTHSSSMISDKEFSATYRVAKEATSSSPSGLHIGHYKAAVQDPILASLHAMMMSHFSGGDGTRSVDEGYRNNVTKITRQLQVSSPSDNGSFRE